MAKKKKKKKTKIKSSAEDMAVVGKLLDMLESGNSDELQGLGAKLGLGPDESQRSFSLAGQLMNKGPDPREIAKLPPVFQMAFILLAEKDEDDELIVDLLELSGDKSARKEAKRALHRMRSRGIDVSVPLSKGSILDRMVEEEQKPLTCQISPVASDGTMVALFAKYTRGGVAIYEAVINDEDGLMEFQGGVIGRKQYRRIEQTISEEEKGELLDVSYDYVRILISEAADRSRAKGRSLPEQYLDASSELGPVQQGAEKESFPDELGVQVLEGDWLSRAEELLDLKEFAEWSPAEKIVQLVRGKLDEVEQSEIIVTEQQRIEQIERAFDSGAKEMLEDEEKRKKWHARLISNARFLWFKDRKEHAQIAAAVAWQLMDDEFEPSSGSFFSKLVRSVFPSASQIAASMNKQIDASTDKDDDEGNDSGNIILTP